MTNSLLTTLIKDAINSGLTITQAASSVANEYDILAQQVRNIEMKMLVEAMQTGKGAI